MTIKKLPAVDSTNKNAKIVKINVGGKPFYSTYGTLKMSPYLKRLLDADLDSVFVVNGDEIFIDRSAQLFQYMYETLKSMLARKIISKD